ncbi:uncharacterized protein LOC135497761 isoform X2 [Lineus longissimus]|uniref:uncharacterized protein LOC135497761 isoform X2 n=1 Tax=Lineus longissimus TaxID=88925 RepID=UPI00315DDCCC
MGTLTSLTLLALCIAILAVHGSHGHSHERRRFWPTGHRIRPHRCGGIIFRAGKLFRRSMFSTLRGCPPGSHPVNRSFCKIFNLAFFMNWSRRFAPKFGLRFGGIRLFRRKGKHPARRQRFTFYLRGKRYVFTPHKVYRKRLFRYHRNKRIPFGFCLPGSRNFPKRRGVPNCKVFNFWIFARFLRRHGRKLFHLEFVRFKFGKLLKRNFRPGGWLNLRWFRNLKHCPYGTRRYGRRCEVIRFAFYRKWLKLHGHRFGINRRIFKWLHRYRFKFYKHLRRHLKDHGHLKLKWFRGLKNCPHGTKRHGHRCKIKNLKFLIHWLRRHAHHFHINLDRLPQVPTLIHYFTFNGHAKPQWRIRRRGGVRIVKNKYLFLPGHRGSTATFRPIRFRGSFTISFYVKPLRVTGRQTLIGSWVRERWLYKLHLVNGHLGAWLRRGPKPGVNMAVIPSTAGKLFRNRWYHIALRWNARTRFFRIFLNGKLVGSKKSKFPYPVELFPNPGRTAIGFKQDSKDENFYGYIAGLRIDRGVVPRRRFIMLSRRIKNFNLHLGGFKYMKSLRRNLRTGGKIYLNWFRRLHKCPPGTTVTRSFKKFGTACGVHHPGAFYLWLVRHGPRYAINISRLPRPRFYHFAHGNRLMRLFPGQHALGGTLIRGRFTSSRCRNWCERVRWCRAVDFNGQTHRCYYHRKPFRRIRATRRSSGVKQVWKIAQYAKIPHHHGVHRFRYGKIFRKQIRKGGIIHLKWFRGLRRCMHGTKRIGKTGACKVFSPRFVFRWIRKHHKFFHFNLSRFTRIPITYHVFHFNGRPKPRRWRIVRRPGVVIKRKEDLFFPGKKGAFATGPRFNKYGGSFTISFYVKPKTVSRNQVLIANWASNRWQYLFRIWKGGQLGLFLRGPTQTIDKVGDMRGGKLLPNIWYSVGFSWNAHTGVAKIYVNGKVVKTVRGKPGNLFANPYPRFQLGYKMDSKDENFYGLIGDLRFTRNILPLRTFARFTRLISGFPFLKKLRLNFRKGGIINLRWFRRRRCMQGTKRVGKSRKCRVIHLRFFRRWLRYHAHWYRIDLRHFPRIPYLYHLYRFTGAKPHNPKWRIIRKGGVRYIKKGILYFPGKRGAYALGRRFNKYRHSFTISFYVKPSSIRRSQTLIAQFGNKRWQYLFRIQKGGQLGLDLRRNKFNTGSDPRQDMVSVTSNAYKIIPKRWNNVGFSWNHLTGVATIYLNGKVVGKRKTRYRDHDLFANPEPWFQLGYKMDSNNENFKGEIAGLRLTRGILPLRQFRLFFKRIFHRFPYGKIFRKQIRKGGIIHLKWFRGLRRCMQGTKRIGKTGTCKVFSPRYLFRWIRKHHKFFHFNLSRFTRIPITYHVFHFNGRPKPRRWRIVRRPGVVIKRKEDLFFPGKKGAFATGPRFNKYGGSFTISFYVKPKTVSRNQVLIANWASNRWQYLFRIWKGGQLGLFLRGPTQTIDKVGDMRGGKLLPNIWYFIGFSWNAHTGVAKIYVNGKVVKTVRGKPGNLFANPYPRFQLGYKMDSKDENFYGLIGDLRFTRNILPLRTFARFTRLITVPAKGGEKPEEKPEPKEEKPKVEPVKEKPEERPEPKEEKPKAPTKLTKENLKPGGKFDLRGVFKGLATCPEGTKSEGDDCIITDYKIFIAWLKIHAATYHIVFARLPFYTTTTTTTTTEFSVGQKFPIDMFKGACPEGTKTVGKFCEIENTDSFLAWLKINAKAYGIEYSYEEVAPGGGSTTGGGGGGEYTTQTETSTTTGGGGFANGQEFPNTMFEGKCPTGTASKGNTCIVKDANSFMGWLKVNGKKYGISFSTSRR